MEWRALIEAAAALANLSAPAVIALVLVAMWRGWIIRSGEHTQLLEAERRRADEAEARERWWRETAVRALNLGEAAVSRDRRTRE